MFSSDLALARLSSTKVYPGQSTTFQAAFPELSLKTMSPLLALSSLDSLLGLQMKKPKNLATLDLTDLWVLVDLCVADPISSLIELIKHFYVQGTLQPE